MGRGFELKEFEMNKSYNRREVIKLAGAITVTSLTPTLLPAGNTFEVLMLNKDPDNPKEDVRDSNPRDGFPPTHFPGVRLRPLGQLSSRRCYQLKRKNCNPLVFVFLKLQVLIMLSGFLIQISLCAKGISIPSLANRSAIW